MKRYNPNIHRRRSIRLKGYDYSQAGLYFVTICVKNRACLFGEINDGQLALNDAGQMVETEWLKLPNRFKNVQLHEYIVMPNHFHAILEITETPPDVRATLVVAQNDDDAQNDEKNVRATLVVAQNDDDARNDEKNVRATLVVAQNEDDAQNDDARNDTHHRDRGQPQGIAPTVTGKTLGDMVGAFQSITTVEYIRGVKNKNWPPFDGKLWHRNYWEHIIRNDKSYHTISEYIINNPLKWQEDKFFEK